MRSHATRYNWDISTVRAATDLATFCRFARRTNKRCRPCIEVRPSRW